MIALFSRWKLKDGCPPELIAAVKDLKAAVQSREPGTLLFSVNLPAPRPPIGPPPDYTVADDSDLSRAVPQTDLVFIEIYRDAEAFSEHLRGAFRDFLNHYRDFFSTPWQGHPRPETTYLDPRSMFVRTALAESQESA